jgi:hypothetical protein
MQLGHILFQTIASTKPLTTEDNKFGCAKSYKNIRQQIPTTYRIFEDKNYYRCLVRQSSQYSAQYNGHKQCFHSQKNNFLIHNPKFPFFPNFFAKFPSKNVLPKFLSKLTDLLILY